jgi:hypothetical protein
MGFKDTVAGLATRLAKARGRPELAEEATKNAVVLLPHRERDHLSECELLSCSLAERDLHVQS